MKEEEKLKIQFKLMLKVNRKNRVKVSVKKKVKIAIKWYTNRMLDIMVTHLPLQNNQKKETKFIKETTLH